MHTVYTLILFNQTVNFRLLKFNHCVVGKFDQEIFFEQTGKSNMNQRALNTTIEPYKKTLQHNKSSLQKKEDNRNVLICLRSNTNTLCETWTNIFHLTEQTIHTRLQHQYTTTHGAWPGLPLSPRDHDCRATPLAVATRTN